MKRLALTGLVPGQNYSIQVRSRTNDGTSPWSHSLDFSTIVDPTPNQPPTNAAWVVSGTSFTATWDAIDPLHPDNLDFANYEVSITDGFSTVRYNVQNTRFDFSYEMNVASFGLPRPTLTMQVRSVDLSNNKSTPTSPITVSNPVPEPVIVSVKESIETIQLSWPPTTDIDIKGYNVYSSQTNGFTPGPSNRHYVETLSWTLITSSGSPWYFHVRAVDVFGQESTSAQITGTAILVGAIDLTPPDAPTSPAVTAGFDNATQQPYFDVTWTASTSVDVRDYIVRSTTDGTHYQYETASGSGYRLYVSGGATYTVGVAARDYTGNVSAYVDATPTAALADTTAPSTPAAPTASGNTMQMQVTHNNKKADNVTNIESDVAFYNVYASKTTGFTDSAANYLGKIDKSTTTSQVFPLPVTTTSGTAADTWYVRVRAVDRAGNESAASSQTSVTPNLIANANIVDATITSAKIVTLAVDKLTAGNGIIADLKIGDGTVNSGSLASSDYIVGTQGWKIGYDKTQPSGARSVLEINQGLIKAKALELRNGGNLMPSIYTDFEMARPAYVPDDGSPSKIYSINSTWSIDVQPKFGYQNIKVVTNGTTSGGIVLGTFYGTDAYNINVEGGREYIVSAYLKSNAATLPNVRFGIFFNTSPTATSDLADVGSTVAATYDRYSYKFAAPAGATKAYVYIYSPSVTSTTFDVDGVQFEEKIGKLDTPSAWMPSSSTVIDGGQIKTGSVQSNAVTIVNGVEVPSWFINLNGKAQFSDATILGTLNIGSVTESGGASFVQSRNFDTDLLTGWRIDSAGIAQFNNASIRGNVAATSAEIIGSLNVTGSGSTPATVSFGNGTTATLSNALSGPPGPPTVTPIEWENIDVPLPGSLTSETLRYSGPAVNSTGDYTFVNMTYDGTYLVANFFKTSNTGTLITTVSTIIGLWDDEEITSRINGFSCHDGTNFSLMYRRGNNDYQYRMAVFDSSYALVSDSVISIGDWSDFASYSPDLIPYMDRVANDLYIARSRVPDVTNNLVRNPSFEATDPNVVYRAYNGSVLTRSTFDPQARTHTMRLEANSSGTTTDLKGFEVFHPSVVPGVELLVKAGDRIYYTLDAEATTSTTGREIQFVGKFNNDTVQSASEWIELPPFMTTYTGHFVVPAGMTRFRLLVRVRKGGGGNFAANDVVAYFDRFRVANNGVKELTNNYFPFVDGSMAGYSWSGSSDNSTTDSNVISGAMVVRKYTVGSYTTPTATYTGTESIGSDVIGLDVSAGDYGTGTTFAIVRDATGMTDNNGANVLFYAQPASGSTMILRESASLAIGTIRTIGGRYYMLDRARNKVIKLARTKQGSTNNSINFAYTYYDPDATGGTHETDLSPILKYSTIGATRKQWRLSGMTIPNIPAGVSATDTPTKVGLYVSYGTTPSRTNMVRLGYYTPDALGGITVPFEDVSLVPGATNSNIPGLTTSTVVSGGSQAPALNQFIGIFGFTPANIVSSALSAAGSPLLKIGGDGVALLGGMKFDINGATIVDDNAGVSQKLQSESGSFLLNSDGTGKWPNQSSRQFFQATLASSFTTDNTEATVNTWVAATTHINNTDSVFSLNTSTGALTVAKTGYYLVNAQLTTSSTAAQLTFNFRLKVNSVNFSEYVYRSETSGKNSLVIPTSFILLTAGDVLTLATVHNAGSSTPIGSDFFPTNNRSSLWNVLYMGPA